LSDFVKKSTSDPEFLRRTGLASLLTGVLAGLVIALRWDWVGASGFMVALLWSVANFAVLAGIIQAATHPEGMRSGRVAMLAAVKLGFYAAALVILMNRWFPVPFFIVGFSWPLVVGVLRGIAPLVIRSGETKSPRGNLS
jgi:hypothetical protein